MFLEGIATTLKEAKDLENAGADRIELLSDQEKGGVTPSIGLIETVVDSVSIPVVVMLRPHTVSFHYDDDDWKVIVRDLEKIKDTGAAGVAFGALDEKGDVDEVMLRNLIELKGPLTLTFHRAIDATNDFDKNINTLLGYDIDTVLTAGGTDNAMFGVDKLNAYHDKFKEKNIELLAGKGLSLENIPEFVRYCKVDRVHLGSGIRKEGRIDPLAIDYIKNLEK